MNLKIQFMCVLVCISLFGCSGKTATIEEDVFMRSFAIYIAALTYDKECNKNDPKNLYDFSKPDNVNLFGNQQMLAARIGGLWHLRYPEKSVEDGVQVLLNDRKTIEGRTENLLKEKGCASKEGQEMAGILKFYQIRHPAAVMGMIEEKIKQKGGQITSSETIEEAGKSPKM